MNPDRAVLIVTALCALVAGCAFAPPAPAVSTVIIDGEVWTEHIDAKDAPESCQGVEHWKGCTDPAKRRIDYRSPVPAWIKKHERAHAENKGNGMTHGPYSDGFDHSLCATVWQPGGDYNTGDTICSTLAGEVIIPSTLFAEAK